MTKDIEGLRKVAEEAIKRTLEGETLHGMTVAGYRWKHPIPVEIQGSEWAYAYASHWSTPAEHENAERLFAESDVLALLSELEAVKGENEANVMIREQQKEDFTRAEAAELALSDLKGEVLEKVGPSATEAAEHLEGMAGFFAECTENATGAYGAVKTDLAALNAGASALRALSSLHEKLSSIGGSSSTESAASLASDLTAGEAQRKSEGGAA